MTSHSSCRRHINISARAILPESLTPFEALRPIFNACFTVVDFSKDTTISALADEQEMKRRDMKSISRPERTIAANVVSFSAPTSTEYFLDSRNLDNTANKDSYSIKTKWNGVRQVPKSQTQERGWDYETTYLTNKFMRLIRMILGRNPELAELADAGFTREEIDLMELTDWMSDDFFLKMVNKRKCIKEKLM